MERTSCDEKLGLTLFYSNVPQTLSAEPQASPSKTTATGPAISQSPTREPPPASPKSPQKSPNELLQNQKTSATADENPPTEKNSKDFISESNEVNLERLYECIENSYSNLSILMYLFY